MSTPGSPGPLVFITGASSGLGQALASHYRRQGWRLALVARRADDLEAWVRAQGWAAGECRVYRADVAVTEDLLTVAHACLETQGLPDVVIASAGISIGMDTADRADLAVMAQVLETNLLGMAATFHPFVQPMCERGRGTLVGIGSVAGIRGLPGHGAYCASKAGVHAYCESLRGELRPSGVKVVTLAPGYVDTPLTRHNRYRMPFLMAPEDFARAAFQAIESGVRWRVIPWPMGVLGGLLRILPGACLDRLLAGRPRKRRQQEAPSPPDRPPQDP